MVVFPQFEEVAMAISVLRGGETAYAWSGEGWAVQLDHADNAIMIKFKISSKGGGVTDVMVKADSRSFRAIASAMMRADPVQSIEAFCAAMQSKLVLK
jgi:hypothetical protein